MTAASNASPIPPLPENGFLGPFQVVVDEDAELVDWDEALAEFLLRSARRKRAGPAAVKPRAVKPKESALDWRTF